MFGRQDEKFTKIVPTFGREDGAWPRRRGEAGLRPARLLGLGRLRSGLALAVAEPADPIRQLAPVHRSQDRIVSALGEAHDDLVIGDADVAFAADEVTEDAARVRRTCPQIPTNGVSSYTVP